MARTEIGEIYYRITGDNSGLKNTLNESDQKSNKLIETFKRVGSTLAAAFVVKQIIDVGKALINAASDANETNSKFGVVFSSISDKANKTASDISESYGLSRTAAKDYLAGVGDILKGLEFTQSASLDTSASIVKLSADLVSFKNYSGGVEGAQHAITSALLGEREALKGLGIAISDADLKAFAAESGKVWEKLTRQEQATLTLALITERAGNAIGDFERTQYGFANQVRIAEGNLDNLKVTLGDKLLPVATLGVIAFNEIIKSVDKSAQSFGSWVTSAEGSKEVGEFLGTAIGTLTGVFTTLEPIIEGVGDAFDIIFSALSTGAGDILDATDAFTAFSVISVLVSDGLKIMATIAAAGITLIIDLGKAFWETGKAVLYFLGLISGDISWSQFKTQVGKAGDAITNLGNHTINSFQKIAGISTDLFSEFGKSVETNTNKASESADKMTNKVSNAIQKSLTATQKSNTDTVESHKGAEIAKTKISLDEAEKRIALLRNNYEEAVKIGDTDKAEHYKNELNKYKDYEQFSKDRNQIREKETKAENEKFDSIQQHASQIISGINNLLSTISSSIRVDLDNTLKSIDDLSSTQIKVLDTQLQEELRRFGVADKTELERLQIQYNDAISKGDLETANKLKNEITKYKITKEYEDKKVEVVKDAEKKKAQAEYKAAHQQWELEILKISAEMALGAFQAFISGLKLDPTGILGSILAGIALSAGTVALVAHVKAEPQPPAFATGGIVPGQATSGDRITAKVNSGEMILTKEQQKTLFDIANSGASSGNYFTFMFDSEMLYDKFYTDSKNGKFKIHKRGVVAL